LTLPIRTTIEDIREICLYLVTKPTGATIIEAKAVLDAKRLDGRKINAFKFWGLIEEQDNKLKVTSSGRECVKNEEGQNDTLTQVIMKVPPYLAIIERAAHRHEDTLNVNDVAAHWHDHFKEYVGDSERIIKDEAVCFFQVAMGAGLGTLIVGRHGQQTRFSFSAEALNKFIEGSSLTSETRPPLKPEIPESRKETIKDQPPPVEEAKHEKDKLGQGIFIAHGKNKKPLEQLKKILDQFRIPYKVAIDEPNLGRPISGKLREIMKSCNCAILIFTADEEFKDKNGNVIWRPSENVVYELGATGYLYDNRIVIMKEEAVSFPSNFSDIGYISFEKDQLSAQAMDILKELIGFGIVKVST
jgi:predicted nucleotide-binding protein